MRGGQSRRRFGEVVSPEEDLVRRSKSRYVYGSSIDDDQDGGRGGCSEDGANAGLVGE